MVVERGQNRETNNRGRDSVKQDNNGRIIDGGTI
jgi:hypothetical protein